MKVAAHRLLTRNPEAALDFYQKLGMKLIRTCETNGESHYFLSLGSEQSLLELIYQPDINITIPKQPCLTEGYWKFSIAIDDLELTRKNLIEKGIPVGECFEVKGLAYLCHITDPNGYCIELIQKTLKKTCSEKALNKVNSNSFNLSTLRVKNYESSIKFYKSIGMKLVYTYRSEEKKMTLFFLVSEKYIDSFYPSSDIVPEEMLWQSPYTLLELQHIDGTECNPDFRYRVDFETGFLGLDMICERKKFDELSEQSPFHLSRRVQNDEDYIELSDPDGYRLRISSQQFLKEGAFEGNGALEGPCRNKAPDSLTSESM